MGNGLQSWPKIHNSDRQKQKRSTGLNAVDVFEACKRAVGSSAGMTGYTVGQVRDE